MTQIEVVYPKDADVLMKILEHKDKTIIALVEIIDGQYDMLVEDNKCPSCNPARSAMIKFWEEYKKALLENMPHEIKQ